MRKHICCHVDASAQFLFQSRRQGSSMWQNKPTYRKEEKPKRRCHRCQGMGRAPCQICNGTGEVIKSRDVYGKPISSRCDGCFGVKSSRCTVCGGEGFV